jgi:hypothetical protein
MTAVEDYAFRNMEGGSGHARPKIGTHAALKLFPGKLPDPKTGSAATKAKKDHPKVGLAATKRCHAENRGAAFNSQQGCSPGKMSLGGPED